MAVPSPSTVERPLDTNEWFFAIYNDLGAYLTALGAAVEGPLTESLLRRAMEHVQKRHPLLRARLEGGLRAPRWVTPASSPIELAVLDAEDATSLEHLAESQIHRPYDTAREPLWRCTFVRAREGRPHGLVLGMHHAVADGLSGLNVFTDLVATCAALHAGEPLSPYLPAGPSLDSVLSPRSIGDRVRAKIRGIRTRLVAPPPAPPRLESRAPPDERRTRVLFRSFPANVVEALDARARREGGTLTGAFSAALLEAVQARVGRLDQAVVNYPVNLRWGLIPPEQVGSFAGSISASLELRGDRSFWSVARRASRQVHAAVAGGSALDAVRANRGRVAEAIDELQQVRLDPRTAGREGFLSLSNRGRCPDPSRGPFRVLSLHPATANHGIGNHFQLSCGSVGDTLHCSFMFVEPLHAESTGRAVADAFQASLEREAAAGAAPPRVREP